jgi:hypothetical protein
MAMEFLTEGDPNGVPDESGIVIIWTPMSLEVSLDDIDSRFENTWKDI